jgi:hypothetical protein
MKRNQQTPNHQSESQTPRAGGGLGMHSVINRRGGRNAAPRSDFLNDFLFLSALFILLVGLAQWSR